MYEKNTRHYGISGLDLLPAIGDGRVAAAFFDPQYRGILDKLKYGNEGVKRGRRRAELTQMPEDVIREFLLGINRVLRPSGHLFLWVDKFHLVEGISPWLADTDMKIVDMVVWNKGKMGMGYRTRRVCEYCVVIQKMPTRAKGVWCRHDIRDVWDERVSVGDHPHRKPGGLLRALIEAVTVPGDLVLDPAAGSFAVCDECQMIERDFIGCDIMKLEPVLGL